MPWAVGRDNAPLEIGFERRLGRRKGTRSLGGLAPLSGVAVERSTSWKPAGDWGNWA
jgi:hypothetical protein